MENYKKHRKTIVDEVQIQPDDFRYDLDELSKHLALFESQKRSEFGELFSKCSISIKWTGYEDCHVSLETFRYESLEEFKDRVEKERVKLRKQEEERRKMIEKRNKINYIKEDIERLNEVLKKEQNGKY